MTAEVLPVCKICKQWLVMAVEILNMSAICVDSLILKTRLMVGRSYNMYRIVELQSAIKRSLHDQSPKH